MAKALLSAFIVEQRVGLIEALLAVEQAGGEGVEVAVVGVVQAQAGALIAHRAAVQLVLAPYQARSQGLVGGECPFIAHFEQGGVAVAVQRGAVGRAQAGHALAAALVVDLDVALGEQGLEAGAHDVFPAQQQAGGLALGAVAVHAHGVGVGPGVLLRPP